MAPQLVHQPLGVHDLTGAQRQDRLSEDRTEATTVQVHADAANMAFHMQVAGEHIRQAAEYLDWSSMRIRIYGAPSEDLLAQMRELAGSGVSVTISPLACGFDRFPEPTP